MIKEILAKTKIRMRENKVSKKKMRSRIRVKTERKKTGCVK